MENGGERELGETEVEEAILLRPKNNSPCTPSKKAIINTLHTASHFRPGKLNRVAKQGYFFLSLSSIYFSKKIDISKICAYTGHK